MPFTCDIRPCEGVNSICTVPVREHHHFSLVPSTILATLPKSEHPDAIVTAVSESRTVPTGSPTTGGVGSELGGDVGFTGALVGTGDGLRVGKFVGFDVGGGVPFTFGS